VKVFLRTFGCRANQYDSEAVLSMVARSGATLVTDPADADVALFNSCAVTQAAESELRNAIRRAARRKPALRSVVMGCASGLELRGRGGASTLRELPTVGALVAGADLHAVAEALGIDTETTAQPTALPRQRGTRALLRIQDGCNEHCTFCATTIARGTSRSRSVADVVAEARRLAEIHPEVVLTGVHIGSYGTDIGSSLGALVERLAREVPETRFRLSSIEATEVDERLAELLTSGDDQVAPHLHAPLQSGSDALLRRMGRHWYTAASYATAVERLAAAAPVLGLGADVIAGFPGETEDDHRATVALVEALPFTYLHVFPYSPRPGTAAVRLPGAVDSRTRARRCADLREAAQRKAAAHAAARSGGEASVVVLRGSPGAREALTEDYLTCSMPDPGVAPGVRLRARLQLDGGLLIATPSSRGNPG
jgi:threonylcarbamoyladenosine tRNA methylthiotransferase MtaB